MKVGDYVEIMHNDTDKSIRILRGIVLQVDNEVGLWPASRVYLFKDSTISWYYEYELTVISEAEENGGTIQGLLSRAGE